MRMCLRASGRERMNKTTCLNASGMGWKKKRMCLRASGRERK